MDYNIIDKENISEVDFELNEKRIIFLSLQDIKGGDEVFGKDKFKNLIRTKIDLLIIDECHHGVETEKTTEFLTKLNYVRLLGLSATPSKNILVGRFTKEHTHIYGLSDERKMKLQFPDQYPYADINFLLWNLSKNEKSNLKYFSDEEQFKFDKFFRIENGNFYYQSDIEFLFKRLIGDRSVCGRDKLGTKYPLKNQGDFSDVRSVLLFVPNISVQEKLKELLLNNEYYKDFDIHITNSEINSSKMLINKVRGEFTSKSKRSLIIAVDQLTMGITLEDCDMVMMMNDWLSMDKYIQASFRCQSPREGKEKCWVVDFNAARSFEMMGEYQTIISKYTGNELKDQIKEWVECVNIYNRIDGEFIPVDVNTFFTEYLNTISKRIRFDYQNTINFDKLTDDDISKSLLSFGLKDGTSSSETKLNDDGIDKGKSKITKNLSPSNKDKPSEIDINKLIEIAKALLDKTMLLTIFNRFEHDDIDKNFEVISNHPEQKQAYLDTLLLGINDTENVDLDTIKYIYDNIYDKDIVNKKLFEFNRKMIFIFDNMRKNPNIINIMLPEVLKLIDNYLKPSNTEKRLLGEVFTPLYGKPGCVEDQLNLMEDSFWKRKDVKVLDPCAGIGNYSVVLIDKFMNGLSDEIPDSEERLKWILEEIIYVNEYQSKNLFIYLQLFDPENKYKINFYRGDYLTLNIKETFGVEKFDLICMNSPYQEMDGGNGASALPLYNLFIEKSIKDSNYIISINPSRWFAGGKGLEGFRKMMLSNKNLKEIIHISDPTLIFGSGVEIKGGISYMIINNTETYENCTFNGLKTVLTDFDILINPKYNKILNKIGLLNGLNNICIGRGDNVFGIQTNDKRVKNDGELICYMSKQKGYKKFIDVKDVKKSIWIDKWKVITAEASGTNKNLGVFGNSFIGKPFEVYSGSYISFVVSSENEANSLLSYIRSKFANFMLSLRKISQHIKPDTCKWIPMVPFDREWTDEQLFDYFNLTDEERNLVMTYDKKDKPKLNVEVVNELTTVL
jgi:site-specific DNA-methyltransferase (adenine-specific)